MSPAPVRQPRHSDRFPHTWGYWLGLFLMVAGVAAAAFFVVTAIQGFRDDVNNLRRAVDVNNLEVNLEEGEYLVFDEDGLDVGPFDVRVFRISDGLEVPSTDVVDGTTYDVDGRQGRARVGFNVPTSDIYRVEVDTSIGDVARFAVGADVGDTRSNRIVQGLVLGAVLFIIGFVAIIWTLILHARWRLRSEVTQRASKAREVLASATEPVGTEERRRESAGEAADRATAWARERIDKARGALPSIEGEHGRPPTLRDTVTERVSEALDTAEQRLDATDPLVDEATQAAEAPADLADRIDQALGRVQERVAKGDRLRDIAADERAVAEDTAAELAARARAAKESVAEQAVVLEDQILERAGTEIENLGDGAADMGAGVVDQLAAQAETTGDELIAGVAASAGGALAAGAERARVTAREQLGVEPPEPPEPPPPPPPSLDEWRAGREPEPMVEAAPQPVAPEPVPEAQPEVATAAFLAPPPSARPLTVSRLAQRATPSRSDVGEPFADDVVDGSDAGLEAGASAPAASSSSPTPFSAIAPPPVVRPLRHDDDRSPAASAPAGGRSDPGDAASGDPADAASGDPGDAAGAASGDPADADDAAREPSSDAGEPPGPKGFALAPPPDYS